jgi:uncharacterized protein (TIGR03435 family)
VLRACRYPLLRVSFWLAFPVLTAQDVSRPAFVVAAIKLNKSGATREFTGIRSPGTFTAENARVRQLISVAYRVRLFQVVGGSGWIDSDRYDITAKMKVEADQTTPKTLEQTSAEMAAMLQSLLEDRFGLKIHREMQDLPLYRLTVAKAGTKMLVSNCTPLVFNQPIAPGAKLCRGVHMGANGVNRTLEGDGADMPTLTNFLANITGRKVVDESGLTARFDFHLEWVPDEAVAPPSGADDPTSPPLDVKGASLFTAVEQQLGLKLDSGKGPVEVIVIDRVEKPSAN